MVDRHPEIRIPWAQICSPSKPWKIKTFQKCITNHQRHQEIRIPRVAAQHSTMNNDFGIDVYYGYDYYYNYRYYNITKKVWCWSMFGTDSYQTCMSLFSFQSGRVPRFWSFVGTNSYQKGRILIIYIRWEYVDLHKATLFTDRREL